MKEATPHRVRLASALYRKSAWRVAAAAATSASSLALGLAALHALPLVAAPLGWLVAGLGLFGFMVLAHDAGHGNLAVSRRRNDWWGEVFCALIAQPFVPMTALHAQHHRHLNHALLDPTWRPWTVERYARAPRLVRALYRGVRGPVWWLGTVFNLVVVHFNVNALAPELRGKAGRSILRTLAWTAAVTGLTFKAGGVGAVLLYLVGPWLVFNAFYSSITYLQHTSADAPRQSPWRIDAAAKAPSAEHLTVHLKMPRLLSLLMHRINFHVPHHLYPAIPFYNLPEAHARLAAQASVPLEAPFNYRTLRDTLARAHIFDPQTGAFVKFEEASTL